jgi:hypothetical protein
VLKEGQFYTQTNKQTALMIIGKEDKIKQVECISLRFDYKSYGIKEGEKVDMYTQSKVLY